MIQYKHFAFASPPRTASTWFIQAAFQVGLGEGQKAKLHEPPPPGWNGYSVSLVRNPYDWLASYYLALEGGSIQVKVVDRFAAIAKRCSDVASFIKWVAMSDPGSVGKMFSAYKPTTVLRVEDLPWCAMEFFDSIKADKSKIRELPTLGPQNTTRVQHVAFPKLKRMLVEAEWEFCTQYDYV